MKSTRSRLMKGTFGINGRAFGTWLAGVAKVWRADGVPGLHPGLGNGSCLWHSVAWLGENTGVSPRLMKRVVPLALGCAAW